MKFIAAVAMSIGLAVFGPASPAGAYPPGPTTTEGGSGVPGQPTTIPASTIDTGGGLPSPTVAPSPPPTSPGSGLPATGSSGLGTTGTVAIVLALAGLALLAVARARRSGATA